MRAPGAMAKKGRRSGRLLLEGATLVTAAGARRGDLAIAGDRFDEVGRVTQARGDRVVDLTGRFIAPGLIDCHTHVVLDGDPDPMLITKRSDAELAAMGGGLAGATLRAGITTVRDNGSRNFVNVGVRNAINSGHIAGPRMFAAGEWLTMTGGHCHFMGHEVDGVDEARKAARLQMKMGSDCVKVIATGGVLTPGVDHRAAQLVTEEIRTIVEESKRAGRKVSAHAHGGDGIKNAVEAGCASVEHGTFMDEEGARAMAKAGVFWVPTMKALDSMRTKGEAHGLPAFAVKKAREAEEAVAATWKLAIKHGVRVAMGTDAGTPFNYHGENAGELELYADYGLSTAQSLATATEHAAELLGRRGEVGTISRGAFADLLVLSRNPLRNLRALTDACVAVLKGGKVASGTLHPE
jgi:imidazolonepropionase-like amidohydrolase